MKNLFNKLLIMALTSGLGLLAQAAAPTMFVDSLELKVGSIKAAPKSEDTKRFEGLPVLVTVFESDEKFPGFMISRSGGLAGDGSDIRFSQNGKILPHEMVDPKQDENGKYESFSFWVRVPEVTAGSTITMHWGVKDGQRPPVNRSKEVWSDYVGVWHSIASNDTTTKDSVGLIAAERDENGNWTIPASYKSFLSNEVGFTISGRYKADSDVDKPNLDTTLLFGTWKKGTANPRVDTGFGAGWYKENEFVFRASGNDSYASSVHNKITVNEKIIKSWFDTAVVVDANEDYLPYFNGTPLTDRRSNTKDDPAHVDLTDTDPLLLVRSRYSAKEIRLAAKVFSAERIVEESAAMSEDYVTLADGAQHVVAEGENYWIREPSLYPLAWSDPSKVKLDVGQAKFGGPSPTSYSVQNAAGTKTFSGGFADIVDPEKNPAGYGAYRIVITTADTDTEGNPIKRLQKIIYFAYVSEVKSQDLRNNQTMLFNDIVDNEKLSGQGFGYEGSGWSVDEGQLVHKLGWKIRYGEIGSALAKEDASKALDSSINYLPFGVDALSYWNPAQQAQDLSDAGAAILYNHSDSTDPAAVYSPVYTNGVGEVYFDAVNMNCGYRNRLELQYLTLSDVKNATGRDDATMADIDDTLWANEKKTAVLEILPIKEGVKSPVWTNRTYVPLMMTKNGDGANTKSFYRVRAKLDKAEHVIFRIARTDSSWGAGGLTGPGKILVDNILVSDPTTKVSLHRLEDTWDPNRDFGKFLHGDRGTLSKRFPKVGDTGVRARVRVTYEGFGSDNLETRSRNVAALIFKYRRRYLNANLGEQGEWKSLRMEIAADDPESGSIFMTPESEPLDLGIPGNPSFDIEYSFEYTPNPTSYDYVDYYALPDCVFDSVAMDEATTSTYSGKDEGLTRTPTLGSDFFFRLREGASDYEQMETLWQLVNDKGKSLGVVTNNLHLIEDHLWTGAIAVTNANARFGFKLRGVNKNERGENGYWRMDTNVEDVKESPYSTIATALDEESDESEGYKWISADLVSNTRQFIIRFNDESGAFSLCRGDYQDFNHWTDAAAESEDKFVAHDGRLGDDGKAGPIANSILQQRFPSSPAKNVFEDWKENVSNSDLWGEKFVTVWNTEEAAKTGNTLLGTSTGVRTPNNVWVGRNFMYVNESLNRIFSSSYPSRAALLKGKGSGSLECDETTSYPDGIGEIKFDARIGQQHSYDRVSTYQPNGDDFTAKDYLVSTRVVMSSQATSATDLGFDGQGTASIFAYHNANGSYEFRMKRLSRNELELGLYRWYQEKAGAPLKAHLISSTIRSATGTEESTFQYSVPGTVLCSTKLADGEGENKTAYVAFLSVKSLYEEQNGKRVFVGNQLYAGLTNCNGNGGNSGMSNHPSVATDVAGREMTWHSFYAQDKGFTQNQVNFKPLRSGTFGFLSTDCPARFMRPQIHDALDEAYIKQGSAAAYAEKITLPAVRSYDGDTYCIGDMNDDGATADDFFDHWYVAPSASIGHWDIPANGKSYYGIVTPDVTQKIIVSTREKNRPDWKERWTVEVPSFKYSPITIPAHTTDPTCVRLSTYDDGDDETSRFDIIVDNIEMTQWHASTSEDLSGDDFVFTGVWTELTNNVKRAEFVPLRVAENEYQTIRSPLLENGIGAISFSYDVKTLDEHAELDIERIWNNDDLTRYNVATYTTNARYEQEWQSPEEGSELKPYRHFTNEELRAAGGHITIYLGKRGGNSLVRLRVPQKVIEEAHKNTDYGNYGRIDITSIAVWDEPTADERSWTAWNVRIANRNTAAKEYVSYDKLLNIDSWLDVGGNSGMSMELNNGFDDLAEDDRDFYNAHRPYIQSPALITPEGVDTALTVGEINFRARKSGDIPNDAYIGVYAVKDLNADERKDGEDKIKLIGSTNLTSTAWQNITIKNREAGIKAIRLVILDKDEKGDPVQSDRALFDELSVTERVAPNVVVTFARAFRNDLNGRSPVATITLPDEQPLCNEEFGIQCELALKQLENVIIPESIEVWCEYYIEDFERLSGSVWGYDNWKNASDPKKRGTIKLTRAVDEADSSRFVYRMTRHTDGSADYIPPIEKPNTIVQYYFRINFRTTQETYDDDTPYTEAATFNPLDPKQWTIPEWYYPVDLNRDYSGAAAYTIIDKVAPKRAWINEVNAWNGTSLYNEGASETTSDSWIELAIPAGVDMSGWRLEAVSTINDKNRIMEYNLMTFGDNCAASLPSNEPFAFYVVANGASSVKHDAVMEIPSYSTLHYSDQIFEYPNLSSYMPYALRLVRPTGIVDHEIIVGAAEDYYDLEDVYDELIDGETGHNKVVKAAMDNAAAFDADGNSVTVSMLNVADMKSLTVSSSWDNTKTATPGKINIDQTIADNYLIYPNDDTLRIICMVRGEGITQDVGNGATTESQLTTVKKDKGEIVKVWYYLKPWYEIEKILVNGVEVANLTLDQEGEAYTFTREPKDNMTIEAVSRTTKVLTDLINDGYPNGNPYEGAILEWMRKEYPTLTPEKLANNLTELVDAGGNVYGHLTLTEMYWIGADPATPEWQLVYWNSAPTPDDKVVDEFGDGVIRMTLHVEYTNGDISKKVTSLASKTYGVNSANWKSSDASVKFEDWTSNGPTLQVVGSLFATSPHGVWLGDRWVPIKCYILDGNSFDENYECEVYLPDPFGPLSITGKYLDWDKYSHDDPFIGWKLQLGERSEKLPGYSLDYLR